MSRVEIVPVEGIGEVVPGSDLVEEILHAARHGDTGLNTGLNNGLADGDIVVVTSKVVSKAEGCVIDLEKVIPSDFASRWASRWDKDPRVVEVVLNQSRRIVRQIGPILITETHHGFVCANAGVDQSSSGRADRVLVLPTDPNESARTMRSAFGAAGYSVAVIVTDTFGRPWRLGQTDVAIGSAGIAPLHSYIGETDPHGHEFRVQELCVADELAGAAELVKGNTSRIPVAIVRGYDYRVDEEATMASVVRDSSDDLFR